MAQLPTKQMALIDRLDALDEIHGREIAQSYIGSGDPDDEPRELTFSEFVAQVRRRSNAFAALGIGSQEVIAFAAPLSETSYPTMVAGMLTATLAPINYFLETDALIAIVRASGATVFLIDRSFDDGAEIISKLKRVHAALPSLRFICFGIGPEIEGAADLLQTAVSRIPEPSNQARGKRASSFRRTTTFEPDATSNTLSSAVLDTRASPKSSQNRVHNSRSSTPKITLSTPKIAIAAAPKPDYSASVSGREKPQ